MNMKLTKWTTTKSLFLSRVLTLATLALAVAGLFCIPIITEWYDAISNQESIRVILTTVLYLSDVLGILALWELRSLLNNIAKQKVFVQENIKCVRIISWCCIGVAALWLVLSFWRLIAFFVAFIAAFVGLVLRVVKNLLAMAEEIREENDYTI